MRLQSDPFVSPTTVGVRTATLATAVFSVAGIILTLVCGTALVVLFRSGHDGALASPAAATLNVMPVTWMRGHSHGHPKAGDGDCCFGG